MSMKIEAGQIIPTSATPPSNAGFYRIDKNTIGVVGNLVQKNAQTNVESNVASGANIAAELAAIGSSMSYKFPGLVSPIKNKTSIGQNIVDFSSLTGYTVQAGSTAEVISVVVPEIQKSGSSIKYTVPAGQTLSLTLAGWTPSYNPAEIFSLVYENLTTSGTVSILWYMGSNASLTNEYHVTITADRYGLNISRPGSWNSSGSPAYATVGYGKLKVTAPAGADAVIVFHGIYSGGQSPSIIQIIADDGTPSNYNLLVPLLDKYRLKAGFAVYLPLIDRITDSQLLELQNSGHDIIPHGESALNTYGTVELAKADMDRNIDRINALGITRGNNIYVYPSGVSEYSSTDRTSIVDHLKLKGIKAAYISGGGQQMMHGGINRYIQPRKAIDSTTPAATILAWLDAVLARNDSATFMVHRQVLSGATGIESNVGDLDTIFAGIASRIASGLCINTTPSQAIGVWE